MGQFNIEICRLEDLGDGTCIIEYRPSNLELNDLFIHCDVKPIIISMEYTANLELEEDRIEMFEIASLYYPEIISNYYL